jgi:hypothetical protein
MSAPTGTVADADAVPAIADWHRRDVATVLDELDSSIDGLDAASVARRRDEVGTNELQETAGTSPLVLIWGQISSVMVLILIGAAVLSLLLGKFLEAGAIGAIVVLFTALGFYQEYRAEQAIAALRRMAVPSARVTREGRTTSVPVAELVPGDIVHLDAGTVVPADLRLVEVASLRIEEATLTGESEPIDKQTDAVDRDDLALGDRLCMAYSGTQVAAGRGLGVVVSTGMRTELGRIASLLQGVEAEPTPLQQRLDRVGKQLALLGVVVALGVVVMGAISGEAAADLVLTAISVAVAVIPEGLPAVVTFTLAIGSQRMLKRQALIRKLPAVETLGSVTVICSDKTGTLTQNRMTVTVLDVAGHHVELHAERTAHTSELPASATATLIAGALCNDGSEDIGDDGRRVWLGDPTETALLQAAEDAGLDVATLRDRIPRIGEQPFDSTRKRMSTIHDRLDGGIDELAELPQDVKLSFVKGAIDGLVDRTTSVWDHGTAVAFDDDWRARISAGNDALAAAGMRVLGVAFRPLASDDDDPECDLVLLGLVGIIDPPRPEVRDAVAVCRDAGIRPVMITGDHPVDRPGDRDRPRHHRCRPGARRRRPRSSGRRTVRCGGPRRLGVRPGVARAQAPHRRLAAEAAPGGGDDRRWRQRRSGAETCRHRRGDGHHRHRRVEGSGRHGAARRQLRHHRRRGRGGAGDLRQPAPVRQLRRRRQPRQDHRDARVADPVPRVVVRRRHGDRLPPAAVAVVEPDDRRPARVVDGRRTGGEARDATPAALTLGQHLGQRPGPTYRVGRHRDRRGHPRARIRVLRRRPRAVADHHVHHAGVHADRPGVRHALLDAVAA